MKAFLDKYGIKRVLISVYYPQANGKVERGHRPIVNALAKIRENRGEDGVSYLPAMLWADRFTTKNTTNSTFYHIVCGQNPVLPIEFKFLTWRILP